MKAIAFAKATAESLRRVRAMSHSAVMQVFGEYSFIGREPTIEEIVPNDGKYHHITIARTAEGTTIMMDDKVVYRNPGEGYRNSAWWRGNVCHGAAGHFIIPLGGGGGGQ